MLYRCVGRPDLFFVVFVFCCLPSSVVAHRSM